VVRERRCRLWHDMVSFRLPKMYLSPWGMDASVLSNQANCPHGSVSLGCWNEGLLGRYRMEFIEMTCNPSIGLAVYAPIVRKVSIWLAVLFVNWVKHSLRTWNPFSPQRPQIVQVRYVGSTRSNCLRIHVIVSFASLDSTAPIRYQLQDKWEFLGRMTAPRKSPQLLPPNVWQLWGAHVQGNHLIFSNQHCQVKHSHQYEVWSWVQLEIKNVRSRRILCSTSWVWLSLMKVWCQQQGAQ
jgi:hypothetical protein